MISTAPAQTLPASSNFSLVSAASIPLWILAGTWLWVCNACLPFWRDLEQYSYGYFVPFLAAYFVWRKLTENPPVESFLPEKSGMTGLYLLCLLILPLEYLRIALPTSRVIIWAIALNGVAITLLIAFQIGGMALLRRILFPTLFFLSAIPWVSSFENNVTMGLMKNVTVIITEVLHFMGVEAVAQGTVIRLNAGLLGIEEACSGIRSLQSGIMYSLAVGELFYLSGGRRVGLFLLTVIAAFILNLIRTFILCYAVELKGMAVLEKLHDQVGIGISLVLPLLVWGFGKLLMSADSAKLVKPTPIGSWLPGKLAALPGMAGVAILGVLAVLPAHGWLAYEAMTTEGQKAPYFTPILGNGVPNQEMPVPKPIIEALKYNSGGYLRHLATDLPSGRADCYYFFWEPKRDNFNIVWHNPEICMTGAGWVQNGEPMPVELEFDGTVTQWKAFPFKHPSGVTVLQLWGAWRNGSPIQGNTKINYLDFASVKSKLSLYDKGRSATEIVSAVVPYESTELPLERAKQVIRAAFKFNKPGQK
ncbi:MAG: exosortase/archaeosortase family protein [Verrucomicrobiota bacterium]|nr:exosortase/archaeosortase family protein [Verrucomicrobiota bacterium]